MDHQNWYYTLSAIAQTCGAILALGGAFVVFKIDKVQQGINKYRDLLLKKLCIEHNLEYIDFSDRKLSKNFNKNFDKLLENPSIRDQFASSDRFAKRWAGKLSKCYERNINAKDDVKKSFYVIISFLTVTIILNLLFLAYIEALNDCIFLIIILFSLVSIVLSSVLFWRILVIDYYN